MLDDFMQHSPVGVKILCSCHRFVQEAKAAIPPGAGRMKSPHDMVESMQVEASCAGRMKRSLHAMSVITLVGMIMVTLDYYQAEGEQYDHFSQHHLDLAIEDQVVRLSTKAGQ